MISKLSYVLFALSAIQVTAFPRLNAEGIKELAQLAKKSGESPNSAKQGEAECPHLAKHKELKRQTTFDPTSQHVSTTGQYAFVAPGAGDQRGPCPGLNALANHGYLPHNGVADIPTIISAVNTGKSTSFQCASQMLGSLLIVLHSVFSRSRIYLPYHHADELSRVLLRSVQLTVWASILARFLQ